ncbi:MAG: hypothetical protein COV36_00560 [Alphaproteobacteria bacterium CG11_big_fil_rev_8_21_14_0_20_44_7]|nr:MAG: hypothetical protein COV36_00560 [Alphaproteobacteria bacterium CG11_big_fil_rev_8_21_14_0_20_44_7]
MIYSIMEENYTLYIFFAYIIALVPLLALLYISNKKYQKLKREAGRVQASKNPTPKPKKM